MKRLHVMQSRMTIAVILAALAACGGGSANAPERGKVIVPIKFNAHLQVGDRPLRQGDSVYNGDRIHAFVTAARDVYLYLGFCDGHQFKLFPEPPRSAIRAVANQETKIPEGEGAYEIASDSKSEVLYLILSTDGLSLATPELAVKRATSGAPADGDCAGPAPLSPGRGDEARPGDSGLEVVRYVFKHPVSTVPPGSARGQ